MSEDVEKLIANGLREGMIHPGDPDKDIPPTPIWLPFKGSPGQPKEMTDLMDGTVKLLSEALVALIEADHEIVPKTEARSMRHAAGDNSDLMPTIPVYCHCDKRREDPLAVLTITDPAAIVIDARALIAGLTQRTAAHPHNRIEST